MRHYLKQEGVGLGCWIEANFPLMGLGSVGGVSAMGVFLRDESPYLREFRKEQRKTRYG